MRLDVRVSLISVLPLLLFLLLTTGMAQTQHIAKVGDFYVLKGKDPRTLAATEVIYAMTRSKSSAKGSGLFGNGASLILLCHNSKALMAIKTDFFIGSPNLHSTKMVEVEYRIDQMAPRKAVWEIEGLGDLLVPGDENLAEAIVQALIKRSANQFSITFEDAVGEVHTLTFKIGGVDKLSKYLPCIVHGD